jgi:hypothetical protein
VVDRCLASEPAERFASAAELLAALGKYLYSLDAPVTPASLSALVAEICPDVPRASDEPGSGGDEGSRGSGTRPMGKGRAPTATGEVKSFATHVDLERALGDNRTPLMPFAAIAGLGEPPPRAATLRSAPAATASLPRRRARRAWPLALAALAALVGVVAWSLRPAGAPGPAPVELDAAARLAGRPVDGGDMAAPADAGPPPRVVTPAPADAGPPPRVVTPAPADAGPPPLPPPVVERGRGRLIVVAPEVAWATVYVDGARVGETPLPAPGLLLPAGRHTLRVVCEPAVCPPDGRTVSQSLTIAADGTESRTIRF